MAVRINKIIKEYNVGLDTVVEYLAKKGHVLEEPTPNTKLTDEQAELLGKAFGGDKELRSKADELFSGRNAARDDERRRAAEEAEARKKAAEEAEAARLAQEKAEAEAAAQRAAEEKARAEAEAAEVERLKAQAEAQQAAAAQDETPADATPDTPAPEQPKAADGKPSVEERAAAMGNVSEDGIYRLRTAEAIAGPKVLGHINLSEIKSDTRPAKRSKEELRAERKARQRKRIGTEKVDVAAEGAKIKSDGRKDAKVAGAKGTQQKPAAGGMNQKPKQNAEQGKRQKGANKKKAEPLHSEISDEDIAKQVKETLARLTTKQKGKGAKYRKEKRELGRERREEETAAQEAESKIIKLTEFVTANELASMMNIPVTKVIATCMSLGIMVSINQRMDAETIELVATEFGFSTEFVSADVQESITEEADNEADLKPRAPIVTVMGHVDHGKTSLLDYIRKANVIAGEAGGITQHIGAYNVTLDDGRHITFLDTPGHEAFTAMRARGAQVTDIAIVIIAADDDIMPQTKEAISHATAAGVPIVFAINKIDKPHANPEKIKEGLAAMNFLVEDWGGKYQSQDISAKKGIGVQELLEKVLLEAEMLELKANPDRKAAGTIIESSLDKGRGYVATVLVSNGTLHQGDIVLAGTNYGRVRALFNERGTRISEVGPAQAATLLGFNGAPQAGDQLHVMETEQEAREIATKRQQLQREQDLRTMDRLTLDKIGKRLQNGEYHEMNIIVKADVDGSVEALADSFVKLSTEKVAVKVVYKGVGQISENDVTLAAASEAVIIGFQVRPSQQARRLADRDGVEIRQYSVIYDAIEEVKEAMEGMLNTVTREEVTANIEVRQVYHISKVGFVAGAYVIDGKVKRTDKARLIRDGIVVFEGDIAALKRFKDDVKEVTTNFECGISLQGCNDIKEGDIIEAYQEIEVKQKL